MPLPTNTTKMPWPPESFSGILQDFQQADAWYSGDPEKLMAYYGGAQASQKTKQNSFEKSFGVSFRGGITFWSRRSNDPSIRGVPRVHVPAAGDIAARSSDLLFGESSTVQIPDAHLARAEQGAVEAEDRLQTLIQDLSIDALLAEAAELASGIGGVYLVPGWDKEIGDHPILTVVPGDTAIPEFRKGYLTAVTFYQTVRQEKRTVWRHLERHESGYVFHGLYKGNVDLLGDLVSLEESAVTRGFEETTKLPDGMSGLLVSYVPNMLPNRKRRLRVGRADTAGSESLMDALDETWTSWMRDIRIGQARIFVPKDWVKRTGRGEGADFDTDQDVFIKLDVDPLSKEAAKVEYNQFEIRHEEHRTTYLEAFEQIIHSAGYSPQSFGLKIEGQAESGTALKLREGASSKTTKKKRRYFEPAVASALEKLLIIDKDIFGSGITPFRPRVMCRDAEPDQMQTASTLSMFNQAEAMSTKVRVKMAQPHLEGEELDAEVALVLEEKGIMVEDPTGGLV